MPRKYSVTLSSTAVSTTKAQIGVTATAAVRPALLELMISSVATPADQAAEWFAGRFTAWTTPTTSANAAVALDDTDAGPTANGWKLQLDATQTLVNNLIVAHNLRATFRWIAAPDEYIWAGAATTKGLAMVPNTQTSAFNESVSMVYME